jgi:transcription elongation factor GreB
VKGHSRWRPPAPRASPFITPAGFAALQDELKGLWVRRRGVVEALSAAAAEGDRSENAEYIYRKKELAGLDRRIRYLNKRLPDLKVVHDRPAGDAVYFGATVQVRDEDDELHEYRIVGADEADAKAGAISVDSPVAKALLGKRVGATVEMSTGASDRVLAVVAVRYV